MPIRQATPEELKRRLDQGERLVLLDVREAREREAAKIAAPESTVELHWPCSRWASEWSLGPLAGGLPVVVYCHHGVRSLAVAEFLDRQGAFDLVNLEGGIEAWSLHADPTVPRY